MSEIWYKELCSDCKSVNWICGGDLSDCTGVDVDGWKCWKCENISLLEEADLIEELYSDEIGEYGEYEDVEDWLTNGGGSVAKGLKSPN